MANDGDVATGLLHAAHSLAPRILACREEIERARQLPPQIARDLKQAGFFRMLVPRSVGGLEVDPAVACKAIEVVARADGSAGWNLMIGVEQGLFSAYLPEQSAQAIWGADPNAVTAGTGAATGRAVAVEGGYQVTGHWSFASGCGHATWLAANCVLYDGATPHRSEAGTPALRWMAFPIQQATILDTWHTGGLRGTGSNDFTATDVFVPEAFSFWPHSSTPWPAGPLFAFPYPTIVAVTMASVATGIARAAIEALVSIAAKKTPAGSGTVLRERSAVQVAVARAEALLRSSRALLYDELADAWQAALGGERPLSLQRRAALRLASVHAADASVQAVDLVYEAAGSTSIYESCPLERCFRDVHALRSHLQMAPGRFETVGKTLLGVNTGTELL